MDRLLLNIQQRQIKEEPFYFGGSQVPMNLQKIKGQGMKPISIKEEDNNKLYNKKVVRPINIKYY